MEERKELDKLDVYLLKLLKSNEELATVKWESEDTPRAWFDEHFDELDEHLRKTIPGWK